MLPKPNKNKKDAENYRRMSLTNCIAKICETAVKNIVLAHCEEIDVFGEMQSAYRRNRCTTDNFLKLTQHVTDIEKAFDAVRRVGLQNKLLQIGVHKLLIKWVNFFLYQRSIFVEINNSKSSTFSTLAGVPQDSVIGPILFLVYASGIPEIPAQISQFSDDFALYYRSHSCRIIQEKLQYSLDKLIKWCEKLKIRINPGKTNFMRFKNPSKKVSSLDLFINGTRIEGANTIKFPGVKLNRHLKWNEQCKSLARANRIIYQLSRLSQINIDEECLLNLYKSWVRSLFLYANACWIDQFKSIINSIQLTQNRALRICMRISRWYSVKKLHEEANILAVRDFQFRLANEYLKRAKEKERAKERLSCQYSLPVPIS